MERASEYVVVYADCASGLQRQVTILLGQGLELVGGVSVAVGLAGAITFAQALALFKESDDARTT